ncbi:unnamed protein product, partial [Brenthis ino]
MDVTTNVTSLGCCVASLEGEEYLCCSVCKLAFHYDCLSITKAQQTEINWRCPECTRLKPKNIIDDNMPVRSDARPKALLNKTLLSDHLKGQQFHLHQKRIPMTP